MNKTPIEALLDKIEYTPVANLKTTPGMPYVTHTGVLKIGELEINVVVLNDGRRIIPEDEIVKIFGEFLDG